MGRRLARSWELHYITGFAPGRTMRRGELCCFVPARCYGSHPTRVSLCDDRHRLLCAGSVAWPTCTSLPSPSSCLSARTCRSCFNRECAPVLFRAVRRLGVVVIISILNANIAPLDMLFLLSCDISPYSTLLNPHNIVLTRISSYAGRSPRTPRSGRCASSSL